VNAVDGWKEDLGDSPTLDVVLEKSERWISRQDALIDELVAQVVALKEAEAQWMPKSKQDSWMRTGPMGSDYTMDRGIK
jgi:hypothetical protein